ncbi:MAG: TRAP transporter permease [Candidatus Cloacimonadota bacterium]|nr:TRAP transporter permease [Candidatus Cloacimonadota bacterium]
MKIFKTNNSATNKLISFIAIIWALFQLSLPKFIILDSISIRAIHLAFALSLVFLSIPLKKKKGEFGLNSRNKKIPIYDYILSLLGFLSALYLMLNWTNISMRAGKPILLDVVVSVILIIVLLEAARRSLGPALTMISILFTAYAFLGPYMPYIFSFRGVSLTKYISKIVLSTEGIYGIPLDVSATTVFLFVLFGAMLEKVGAGNFFNDISISLLGKYKGGPAKAAVVSSGFTGLVSGSSIANVATTGTFTIPMMKKVGYPAKIAAATEVAASTNGQLMPPIMGAAAFIIAEFLAIDYLEVIKAAAIPAVVSYIALFYITHLEASKRGLKGLSKENIPKFWDVIKKDFYFLIPLFVLIIELIAFRHSPNMAAFNAIISLVIIVILREIIFGIKGHISLFDSLKKGLALIVDGLIRGSKNMLPVAIATATAGIVVGIVTMGIGSMIVEIVETIAGGNILLMLVITAIASLILGMGLPTTATYIVMATITVPVIIKLTASFGMNPIPAISAHLFCFYFGILADDTPPVGLAAYTAAAIAKSDPIATGVQGFIYDLRTAVIPFMFVFNAELVLYGVHSFAQAILIFLTAVLGALAFTNLVQGWFLIKNKWFEIPFFACATLLFFYPAFGANILHISFELRYYMYFVAAAFYFVPYIFQKFRMKIVRI